MLKNDRSGALFQMQNGESEYPAVGQRVPEGNEALTTISFPDKFETADVYGGMSSCSQVPSRPI
jgi:hypothetical protein